MNARGNDKGKSEKNENVPYKHLEWYRFTKCYDDEKWGEWNEKKKKKKNKTPNPDLQHHRIHSSPLI